MYSSRELKAHFHNAVAQSPPSSWCRPTKRVNLQAHGIPGGLISSRVLALPQHRLFPKAPGLPTRRNIEANLHLPGRIVPSRASIKVKGERRVPRRGGSIPKNAKPRI